MSEKIEGRERQRLKKPRSEEEKTREINMADDKIQIMRKRVNQWRELK